MTPGSRLIEINRDIQYQYPYIRTLIVLAILSAFSFSSNVGNVDDYSLTELGIISFISGAVMVGALNAASLVLALLWKFISASNLENSFKRVLVALYFVPMCIALIWVAILIAITSAKIIG